MMTRRESVAWSLATVATLATIGLASRVWRLNRALDAVREERTIYYHEWCDEAERADVAERELEILRIGVGAMEPEPEPAGPPIG